MTREMAKGICQHFLDAHLIETATDLDSQLFKDRGIYMLTPKGLHILERFITKNGITAPHLMTVFGTQPIVEKLLHLERRAADDEIIVTKSVMEVLFRRFVGREPNLTTLNEEELEEAMKSRFYAKNGSEEVDRSRGVILHKIGLEKKEEYQFSGISAVNWLSEFTTCVGMDEAAEVAAQFVRYGLIAIVSDKGRVRDQDVVVSVRSGGAGGGSGGVMVSRPRHTADER